MSKQVLPARSCSPLIHDGLRRMTSVSRSSVFAIVHLDRDATVPVRQQLYARIRELIVNGNLAADAQLPSTRTLAAELGVSRNTVVAAFDQLIAEGYVE